MTGGSGPAPAPGGLRRFARPQRPRFGSTGEPDERCELCGERIGGEHPHMVDLDRRSIVCACRASRCCSPGLAAGTAPCLTGLP